MPKRSSWVDTVLTSLDTQRTLLISQLAGVWTHHLEYSSFFTKTFQIQMSIKEISTRHQTLAGNKMVILRNLIRDHSLTKHLTSMSNMVAAGMLIIGSSIMEISTTLKSVLLTATSANFNLYTMVLEGGMTTGLRNLVHQVQLTMQLWSGQQPNEAGTRSMATLVI